MSKHNPLALTKDAEHALAMAAIANEQNIPIEKIEERSLAVAENLGHTEVTCDDLIHAALTFYWKTLPYKRYLDTGWWKWIRQRAIENLGGRCQICNSNGLIDVHHRTYERLGYERRADLVVLCRTCHSIFHENGRLQK
jgi:hypothetical protein